MSPIMPLELSGSGASMVITGSCFIAFTLANLVRPWLTHTRGLLRSVS